MDIRGFSRLAIAGFERLMPVTPRPYIESQACVANRGIPLTDCMFLFLKFIMDSTLSRNCDSLSTKAPSSTQQDLSILMVSSIDISLLRFRGLLIQRLIEGGYRVVVAAPEFAEDTRLALEALGAEPREYPLNRTGMNPLKDWKSLRELRRIMIIDNIGLVFSYNLKPVIYASLAAASLRIPAISLITGLGYGFSGDTRKARALGKVLIGLYRRALSRNSAVIFQNNDDKGLFHSLSLVPASASVTLVDGSGVDLNEFRWRKPRGEANLRFMFAGRLIKEKGVELFIEAASTLKAEFEHAEFFVLGDPQPGSPSSIDLKHLRQLHEAGTVTHYLRRPDIGEFMAGCDVLVLPSYYREGVPRTILEALSTGLAVITADGPGCRETVSDGVNGFLVKPKDLDSLLNAMRSLLANPQQIVAMSAASRQLAEARFDVHKVNDDVLAVVENVLANR